MPLDDTNSVTFDGVQIWDEGQRGGQGQERSGHFWQFCCLWTDYPLMVFKMLGGTALVSGVLTLAVPFHHPRFPWLAATNVEYEGIPGENGLSIDELGMVAYEHARLTVEFTSFDPSELGEERIDRGFKQFTVPDGTFYYMQGTNKVRLPGNESPGLIVPHSIITRTVNNTVNPPSAAILSLLCHVNASGFLGAGSNQLLYMGCTSRQRFTSQGERNFDLTHCLHHLAVNGGWNAHLIPGSGATPDSFKPIFDQNDNPPYPSGDLSTLGFTT